LNYAAPTFVLSGGGVLPNVTSAGALTVVNPVVTVGRMFTARARPLILTGSARDLTLTATARPLTLTARGQS